ncbi:aspartic proteinase CDR1-like [Carya illinoinensis]|uniref:Peptidase A1 domain-containing protein n=1 Tax=Carya illinoinensis TaxID=32201 RepID=A0A8T1NTQ1_CARIL|nr:aspartic proteinase CDR1-like [Carya illinoinensis]KAG6633795.1 hypothetical protein CIPAW_12G073200 [Carya illinoinensis]
MAAALRLSSFVSTLALIYSFHLSVFSFTEASDGTGFTVDLIQRDSALSPSYNPSHTHFDRLHNAFRRSVSRANRFKPTPQSKSSSLNIQSQIMACDGEYLMKISIGTPPVELLCIADTGSDLTWTQCRPCEQCYKQNASLFDPEQSSTYRNVPCKSKPCQTLERASCGDGTCKYSYSYGDNSFTNGDLAVETLVIGSTSGRPISIPEIILGCGHNNDGTFGEAGSGIIGLGDGSLSLVSQLKKSVGGKFSYCLVPNNYTDTNTTSKITFGNKAVVSGDGVVSTALVAKEPDTFYFLSLEAISVGNKRFAYKGFAADHDQEGNIIIDSGTTLTFLPPEFHTDLVSALVEAIDAERVSDPRNELSLCFKSEGNDIDFPIIIAHFAGADVKLQPFNTFARMDEKDNMVCFTMVPSESLAIFGNLAQMNFLVGYDLEGKELSFLPTDCTKQYY